jgi:hypothetical protein
MLPLLELHDPVYRVVESWMGEDICKEDFDAVVSVLGYDDSKL